MLFHLESIFSLFLWYFTISSQVCEPCCIVKLDVPPPFTWDSRWKDVQNGRRVEGNDISWQYSITAFPISSFLISQSWSPSMCFYEIILSLLSCRQTEQLENYATVRIIDCVEIFGNTLKVLRVVWSGIQDFLSFSHAYDGPPTQVRIGQGQSSQRTHYCTSTSWRAGACSKVGKIAVTEAKGKGMIRISHKGAIWWEVTNNLLNCRKRSSCSFVSFN